LYEGFGIPIIEALQCDVPVLAANNSSMPEIGGEAILYANALNVEDIAHQMGILSHFDTHHQAWHNAKNEILTRYTWEKATDLFGIFHCFTGDFGQAKRAIDLNMKLGIGGVATFKNGKIDQFLKDIDLQHIVLETDSPYLAPVPHRGKRNESSYTKLVAEKLAQIYQLPIAEIARITTENSKAIFGILQ
jgi:TatD family hydrolase